MRQDVLEVRFDSLEGRFDRLENDIAELRSDIRELRGDVGFVRSEVYARKRWMMGLWVSGAFAFAAVFVQIWLQR